MIKVKEDDKLFITGGVWMRVNEFLTMAADSLQKNTELQDASIRILKDWQDIEWIAIEVDTLFYKED